MPVGYDGFGEAVRALSDSNGPMVVSGWRMAPARSIASRLLAYTRIFGWPYSIARTTR